MSGAVCVTVSVTPCKRYVPLAGNVRTFLFSNSYPRGPLTAASARSPIGMGRRGGREGGRRRSVGDAAGIGEGGHGGVGGDVRGGGGGGGGRAGMVETRGRKEGGGEGFGIVWGHL